MEDLRKVVNDTEVKNIENTEYICKKIIKQMEFIFGYTFNMEVYEILEDEYLNMFNSSKTFYLNIIIKILMDSKYSDYQETLLELLQCNHVNEQTITCYILGVINQMKNGVLNQTHREELIKSFSKLPFCQNISWDDKKIDVETKYGRFLMFCYNKILTNDSFLKVMKSKTLSNHCHSVVEYLKDYFYNDYIITSEISLLFGGYIYHSYFKTNDGVVDVANNTFYPKDDFDRLFNPKEILKIKAIDFDKVYQKFIEKVPKVDDVAPVLALALNNKRRLCSI